MKTLQCPDRCSPNSWDSVPFHDQRNTSGETQSAQYSIALFVASDATDTWQSCRETLTQGCVTLWSEPAVSTFQRKEQREKSVSAFVSLAVLFLLTPPPFLISPRPSNANLYSAPPRPPPHTNTFNLHCFSAQLFPPIISPPQSLNPRFPSRSPPHDYG